jgi:hypothetical protein
VLKFPPLQLVGYCPVPSHGGTGFPKRSQAAGSRWNEIAFRSELDIDTELSRASGQDTNSPVACSRGVITGTYHGARAQARTSGPVPMVASDFGRRT